MPTPQIATVDDLFAILASGYRRYEERAPGDDVDLITHSLQAAHEAYLIRPADEELQVAALVHDIGHLISGHDSSADHARLGAAAVRGLLGPRVADLVGLHIEAKRFLATDDDQYWANLTAGSRRSLITQGGLLTAGQQRRFERRRHARDAVVLRAADDLAHDVGRAVPSLLSWRPVLDAIAAATIRDRQLARQALGLMAVPR